MDRTQITESLLSLPQLIERAELALLVSEGEREEAQSVLLDAEGALIIAGVEGKNEAQRSAIVREETRGQRLLVAAAEKLVAVRRVELKRLQNEFSGLKAIARLMGGEA